jgi:hypothetical protein
MLCQKRGCPEAALSLQVVGNNRLARLESVTGGARGVGPDPCLSHDARFPADTGPHQELMLRREVFHNLTHLALQPFCANSRCFLQQGLTIVGLQGEVGVFGGELLLA